MSVKDFLNLFHVNVPFSAADIVGAPVTAPYNIQGYSKIRVVVEDVGALNEIEVYGRLKNQVAYVLLATITGPEDGASVTVSDYDEIYFDCATYDNDGDARLIVSGVVGAVSGGGGGGAWGSITGTLSDQTDLNTALGLKAPLTSPAFVTSARFGYSTASTVPYFDASKDLVSSAVTPTELGYLSGVSSAIQTQLDAKLSGSASAGQVAYWSGASSVTGSANLTYTAAVSGASTTYLIAHPDNASGSNAVLNLSVAGTSAGDPTVLLTVTSGTSWYAGVDNSASDSFFLGTGTAVGTNPMFRVATDGIASFYGTGLRFNTGGTSAQITEIYAGAAGGNDGGLALYGGNGSGAYAVLYGASHATLAGLTNFSGTARLTSGGDFFLGSAVGPYSYGVERLGVRLLAQSANSASAHAAAEIQYLNNNDTAFTASQVGVAADWRRTITSSTTDTGSIIALNPSLTFTVSAGRTYTNATSSATALLISSPSLSGGGALALSNYAGINIATSSTATGSRKTAILIGAQAGASNNALISDSAAYSGDYSLYLTNSTNPNYLNGPMRLGVLVPNSYGQERLSLYNAPGNNTLTSAGLSIIQDITGNVDWSPSGLGLSAASFNMKRTVTSGTVTDTANRSAVVFAYPTITISGGATYVNATTNGYNAYEAVLASAPTGTMSITHHAAFYLAANSSATGTNKYGIRIGSLSGATNNYAFYSGTGQLSIGDYLEFRANHDPGAPTDAIRISSKVSTDSGTPNTLHLRTEQAVEDIGTFTESHKLRVWINNVEYHISLDAV